MFLPIAMTAAAPAMGTTAGSTALASFLGGMAGRTGGDFISDLLGKDQGFSPLKARGPNIRGLGMLAGGKFIGDLLRGTEVKLRPSKKVSLTLSYPNTGTEDLVRKILENRMGGF